MAKSLQKIAQLAKEQGDLRSPKEIRADSVRQKKFLKEVILPYLETTTESVIEAQRVLTYAAHVLKTSFDTMMAQYQKKMNEGELTNVVIAESVMSKDYEAERKFLALFSQEKVKDAMAFINWMNGEIGLAMKEEMRERKLETVDIKSLK